MMLGRVVGTVVSSSRNDGINGAGYLLIARSDQQGEIKNDFLVALDLVGAGRNELVMISEGSSARETEITFNKPMDAVIVGIVDMIDEYGKTVYRKNIS
jgi:microcompartment protein CcmK/EutM